MPSSRRPFWVTGVIVTGTSAVPRLTTIERDSPAGTFATSARRTELLVTGLPLIDTKTSSGLSFPLDGPVVATPATKIFSGTLRPIARIAVALASS